MNAWERHALAWHMHVGPSQDNKGRAGARRSQGCSQALRQRDYWDRYIRDERHFHAVKDYIHHNPVAASLATVPEDWPRSSTFEDVRRTSQ
jgi:REP element-mobilizing transposase RayT